MSYINSESEVAAMNYRLFLKKRRRAKAIDKIIRSAAVTLFPFAFRNIISEMSSVRWSFKANQWEPTRSQLLQISSIVQPEEKDRIARFHFMRDAKSSLVGRLLIRKLICVKTGAPNHLIKLARDEHNKPILISPKLTESGKFQQKLPEDTTDSNAQETNNSSGNTYGDQNETKQDNQQAATDCDNTSNNTSAATTNLNFNVSHQGKFVVLVSEPVAFQVGIDVMNVEKPGRITESVEDYFRLMNRQFTENEWKQIRSVDPSVPENFRNRAQLTNFTRFWCLKESYVKAVGVGIVIDLRSIDFTTKSDIGPDLVTDTTVKVNGVLNPKWKFEERFLDDLHIVTVARLHSSIAGESEQNDNKETWQNFVPEFECVSLCYLLEGMSTLGKEDNDWVDEFLKKK